MPLHIKDEATDAAVRRLAAKRNLTLTEAVRMACEEALRRDARATPVAERLADFHARLRGRAGVGEPADKAFFDRAWGDEA